MTRVDIDALSGYILLMSEAEPRTVITPEIARVWRNFGLEDFIPADKLEDAIGERMRDLAEKKGVQTTEYAALRSILRESGLYPHYVAAFTAHFYGILPSKTQIGDRE